MRHLRGFTAGALLLGCAVGLISCEERNSTPAPAPAPTPKLVPSALEASAAEPKKIDHALDALSVSEIPHEQRPAPAASTANEKPTSKLIIDIGQQIGPAGQMTASARGVVMIGRNDEIQISKPSPAAGSSRPEQARFSKVKGGPSDFFAVARGPLLAQGKAYWVRDGKLVRRALDNSTPLETLASDARNGTRVVGADLPDAPAHALYITNTVGDEAPRAKLWVQGAGTVTVSPEGAGASSIAVARAGSDLFIVAIDARSAMTPLHGRRLRFRDGKPELDADVVMWVGSTSQTQSEVFATTTPEGVRAFLPIERDVSHFGLVMLDLGSTPRLDPKTAWRGYPNGIDVAPVAGSAFCGSAFVAYVRPETASPDGREVLEIAEITETGLGPAELVDSASGFANISLASAPSSAVLAYVADFRTFATTLRCSHQK